ncbi:hypothetical protein PIB30_077791, partial [Stylosanthes scabra]|nr:hypothetical protein [Stylosanthes scabra]
MSIFSGLLITKKYTKSIFTEKESHPKRALNFRKANTLKLVNKSDLEDGEDLGKPRTKISKDLMHEFYTNAVRTEEELAGGEDYPYISFVRGKEVDFSAAKIREVLRIKHMTLGAETNFKTRQYEDQRLDEDLTLVARGWAEFIIHSMIPIGNKSEITVARAVLIHSIIKGHDVRVEV